MSQFSVATTATNVPTSFITDSGTAIPVANVININGASGITTSGSGNSIIINLLENTIRGTGTTVGTTPLDLITYSPTDQKGFSLQGLVVGYDLANNVAIGGEIIAVGRKSGTVTIVSPMNNSVSVDASLSNGSFTMVASGASFILRVRGDIGHTIAWSAYLNINQTP